MTRLVLVNLSLWQELSSFIHASRTSFWIVSQSLRILIYSLLRLYTVFYSLSVCFCQMTKPRFQFSSSIQPCIRIYRGRSININNMFFFNPLILLLPSNLIFFSSSSSFSIFFYLIHLLNFILPSLSSSISFIFLISFFLLYLLPSHLSS